MFTEKLCSGIFCLGTKIKSGITETEKVQNVAEGECKRHNLRKKKEKPQPSKTTLNISIVLIFMKGFIRCLLKF